MINNVVGWFEIQVENIERAKAFYEAVFKFSMEKLEDEATEYWAFPCKMGAEGAGGALFKYKEKAAVTGAGGTMVYFMCEDCAVEEARVVPHGGEVLTSKKSLGPHGFITIVKDTEGNHIGLHSMK